MKRFSLAAVLLAAAVASADPAPTTRPIQAPEPDPVGETESAAVVLEKDGYKATLTWYPKDPQPGDLVRYRLKITVPGEDAPSLMLKASVTRTGPGNREALRPSVEVPSETTPQDGRYVFGQVVYEPGTYEISADVNDLAMGKSVTFTFPAIPVGKAQSNSMVYVIGAVGLVIIVILVAFGFRRRAAE